MCVDMARHLERFQRNLAASTCVFAGASIERSVHIRRIVGSSSHLAATRRLCATVAWSAQSQRCAASPDFSVPRMCARASGLHALAPPSPATEHVARCAVPARIMYRLSCASAPRRPGQPLAGGDPYLLAIFVLCDLASIGIQSCLRPRSAACPNFAAERSPSVVPRFFHESRTARL